MGTNKGKNNLCHFETTDFLVIDFSVLSKEIKEISDTKVFQILQNSICSKIYTKWNLLIKIFKEIKLLKPLTYNICSVVRTDDIN